MPNKEEILEKHLPTPHLAPETYSIYEAMDEYAKQQVIEFTKWTFSDDCEYASLYGENETVWFPLDESGDTPISTEQLYEIYIKQQHNDTMGI